MKKWFLLFLVAFGFITPNAYAHTNTSSTGYSKIEVEQDKISYELQLDLLGLSRIVDLGVDSYTPQTKEELGKLLDGKKDVVKEYLNSHIKLYADSVPVEGGEIKAIDGAMVQNQLYASIILTYSTKQVPTNLIVNYSVFFDDNDPGHTNYAKISKDGKQQEFVFSASARELQTGQATFFQKVKQFMLLGMEHIFTGYDHILFLISLLLGAKTLRHVLSLVTAFTIAHSVTLALATLQIVNLPSKLVESSIALSIVYVALQNIFNQKSEHHPLIAFTFGLMHGFGFANVLTEMRLDMAGMATSLLFFNVGIELGQLILVALFFPLILYVRKKWTVHWFVPVTSAVVVIFGVFWFAQRAFPWWN
jgi:hydrogenase/urease accessory protein HupE